jgi:HAD superfamily hydrolase (TIGR01509 family)
MNNFFDGIVASSDVGATKEEPAFYQKAMEMFNITDPSTVAFTDDDPKNVEIAKGLGINTFVFEGVKSLDL